MYLFFDTETTGIPKNYKAPVTDLKNWPRMVQLACLVFDDKGRKISGFDHIIIPDGFKIPANVAKIHGISTERAKHEGKPLPDVLNEFHTLIKDADYLVAHNMGFDEMIAGAEFIRLNMVNLIPRKNRICTMLGSKEFCSIIGPYGYKWPKLSELHYRLFKKGFADSHNAAVDIQATAKCFWELRRLKVL